MHFKTTMALLVSMRKSRKISQLVLCKQVDSSQREISYIENGKRPYRFETIGLYLSALQSYSEISIREWNQFIRAFLGDVLEFIYRWTEETSLGSTIKFNESFIEFDGEKIPIRIALPKYKNIFKDIHLSIIAEVFKSNFETRMLISDFLNDERKKSIIRTLNSIPEERYELIQRFLDALKESK